MGYDNLTEKKKLRALIGPKEKKNGHEKEEQELVIINREEKGIIRLRWGDYTNLF